MAEDAKEYWWYVDSTPTHSWMRWRYLYPQVAFPYDDLLAENQRRGELDPEYELADTGVLDSGFWDITLDYAKETPEDLILELCARNTGATTQSLHILPTLWFRNTWAWGITDTTPSLHVENGRIVADHTVVGRMFLTGDGDYTTLVCDNESNAERLWGSTSRSGFPKDGINDHVIHAAQTVNPAQVGTKGALHYVLSVDPGEHALIRLRFGRRETDAAGGAAAALELRHSEADAFYASVMVDPLTTDERLVVRQALSGMLWGKQFYHYNVTRWLDGDPAEPAPPAERLVGRNAGWRHVDTADVLSMPDKWEYPWFAAWDLGFQCVALAHVDPEFAKQQLILLCREWYMHANGQLPAYEWSFDDVNPPVHAWAALRVFEIDGATDYQFLARVFHKLLINFTWWVNREDAEGNNIFEGGFLGLDNVGPFNRSAVLPAGGHLEQSDGTAWMAMYSLNLLEIALILASFDRTYEDVATKFFEHFATIATAMNEQGLWDEDAGFYYDSWHLADGTRIPIQARSIVGLIPLCAATTLGHDTLRRLPDFAARLRLFIKLKPRYAAAVSLEVEDDAARKPPARDRRPRPPAPHSRVCARRVGVPERPRPARAFAISCRPSARGRPRRYCRAARLRARGIDLAALWRQLELAWTGLVSSQPPDHRGASRVSPLPRRRMDRRVPARVGPSGAPRRGRRRHRRASCIHLPEGPDGVRPVVAGINLYTRPDLADAIPFHEYFHAETGQGPRRIAPDRVDRPGRRPAAAPNRCSAIAYDVASLSDRAATLG